MGDTFYVERESNELSFEEWVAAVKSCSGARLATAGSEMLNPKSGEVISMPCKPGDVEVLFRQKGFFGFGSKAHWRAAIRFSRGRGVFNATDAVEAPGNPVRVVAACLARALGAIIVGEEGEIHDWQMASGVERAQESR